MTLPPEFATPAELQTAARLGARLREIDYTSDAVTALIGAERQEALRAGRLNPLLTEPLGRAQPVTPGGEHLVTLVRLWQLGQSVSADAVDAALPEVGVTGLTMLGLVAVNTVGEVSAQLAVNPVSIADAACAEPVGWILISDLDDYLRSAPVTSDFVMGVGGATRSLIAQADPAPVGVAADIGTGCGVVALHLRKRAPRVIATDISLRALRFAALNFALNAVDGIELRHGSLLEPLAGERVDMLLSNPPFVITPPESGALEYRSTGEVGDGLARRLIGTLPTMLAPGGSALLLLNWELREGAGFADAPAEWLAAAQDLRAVDAVWIVEREQLDPFAYAQMWVRDAGQKTPDSVAQAQLDAYLSDFKSRCVRAVSFGTARFSMAPAPAPAVTASQDAPAPEATVPAPIVQISQQRDALWRDDTHQAAGDVLAKTMSAAVRFARLSDAELLASCPVLSPRVLEERIYRPGEEHPSQLYFLTTAPYQVRQPISTLAAAALGACDGELSVQQIIAALAEIFAADSVAVTAELLPQLREFAWLGFFSSADAA